MQSDGAWRFGRAYRNIGRYWFVNPAWTRGPGAVGTNESELSELIRGIRGPESLLLRQGPGPARNGPLCRRIRLGQGDHPPEPGTGTGLRAVSCSPGPATVADGRAGVSHGSCPPPLTSARPRPAPAPRSGLAAAGAGRGRAAQGGAGWAAAAAAAAARTRRVGRSPPSALRPPARVRPRRGGGVAGPGHGSRLSGRRTGGGGG